MPAAPSATVEAILSAITSLGMFAPEELDAEQAKFPDGQWPQDPQKLIEGLVRTGKLTKFQGQLLYSGRGQSLVLGDYVLLDKLGAGGMGQVFKARHRRMQRVIALKVLPAAVQKDAALIARFQREVVAAAKLTHPNVVVAYDAGEYRGVHYLVTEYVAGCDLGAFVKDKGPLPPAWAVEFLYQAALGLDYAHRQGVIHRDIKPSNFLVSREGAIKVADLGLARVLAPDESIAEKDAEGLTNTGAVMGTVDYMAPEQAIDTHLADARSDIYSLGCTLHFLLTAKAMFPTGSVVQKILAHREQPPPVLQAESSAAGASSSDPDTALIEPLNTVFQRMVAKRPDDRFAAMEHVVAALQPLRRKLSIDELNQRGGGLRMTAVATSLPRTDPATNSYAATMGPTLSPTNPLPTIVVGDSVLNVHRRSSASVTKKPLSLPVVAGGVTGVVLLLALVAWSALSRPEPQPAASPEAVTAAVTTPKAADVKSAKPKRVSKLPPDQVLDRGSIPADEIYGEQPPELVAILGNSARRHWAEIYRLVYDDRGTTLFSSSVDNTLVAWDAQDLKRLGLLTFLNRYDPSLEQRVAANTLVWDAKRQCLWAGVTDATLRRVDWNDGKFSEPEWWYSGSIAYDLQLSPDGRYLASLDNVPQASLWDLSESPPRLVSRWKPAELSGEVRMSFSPSGRELLMVIGQEFRMFDVSPLSAEKLPEDWQPAPIEHALKMDGPYARILKFDPQGQQLAMTSGGVDTRIRKFDPENPASLAEIALLPNVNNTAAFSPDGRWLASSANSATLQFFDRRRDPGYRTPTPTQIRILGNTTQIAYRPDSQRLVIESPTAGKIAHADTSLLVPRELHPAETGQLPSDLKWSPDGRYLVVCTSDQAVQLWEFKERSFQLLKKWNTNPAPRGASWSADGQWLAFSDGWISATLNVIKTADLSRTEVIIPDGYGHGLSNAEISPDGLHLAYAGTAGKIHFWNRSDAQSGWILQPAVETQRAIASMAFSPNSQRLAVAVTHPMPPVAPPAPQPGAFLTIVEFGGSKRWLREELPLESSPPYGQNVAWTPDGKKLFAYGGDPNGNPPLRVYDVANDPHRYLFGAHVYATGLSVSPDGKYVAAAGGDTVTIFTTEPMYPTHTYRMAWTVNDVDWHPSGEYLATSNANGTVYILKVPETLLGD